MSIKANNVQELAYQLWEKSGKPEGQAEHFWFMAENIFNKTNNISELYLNGKKSIRSIAKETGIPRSTIQDRLKRGKSLQEAVNGRYIN